MAYRNANGQITIDEQVALADVAKEAEAAEILENTKRNLEQIINEASFYKGDTITAIIEKSEELIKNINQLVSNLEETQVYTKKVVAHYKAVDQQCAEVVRNI